MAKRTEKEWQELQQKLEQVRAQLAEALEHVTSLTQDRTAAPQRIAELEAQKTPPPTFVKANKPEKPKIARKKRASEQNRARRCEPPTQVVAHSITEYPQGQGALSSIQVGRTRQVIELPPLPPGEILEHQRGWCSYCRKWQEAPLDVRDQVVGQGRIGIRLATTIATMRPVLRLPIRLIQRWLATQHQVQLSVGALIGLLRRLATHWRPVADHILTRLRGSPAVFAEETGGRENGQNGYIWEVGTPEGERYYERHASRAGLVINTLLGDNFRGVLTTAGSNDTPGGQHQRCWVHLLRDLHALKAPHPQHAEVQDWATELRAVSDQAVAARGQEASQRQPQWRDGEAHLWTLGQRYAGELPHPCQT